MTSNEIVTEDYEIIPLEWDSRHFGVNCAKVIIKKQLTRNQFEDIKRICDDYTFVTINNKNNIDYNNFLIGSYSNAFITDMQVIFSKKVENMKMSEDVFITNNFPADDAIVKIAENNFVFSRFFKDPNIDKTIANATYGKWIVSSFNREDRYFAICKNKGVIEGIFLFAFDDQGNADQGKGFMVVNKTCQGRGVGKRLIKSVEAFAFSKGSTLIYGGTQADNIKMVNHYMSDGYKYTENNSIYHMWKDNEKK